MRRVRSTAKGSRASESEARLLLFGELRRIAERILKLSDADETEVMIDAGADALTRFANNMIHQSIAVTDAMCHVRLIFGKKIGVARTNRLDEGGVIAVVAKAVSLAKLQQPDPHFKGLPEKSMYPAVSRHYKEAKHIGAVGRAKAVHTIISVAIKQNLSASGAFSEGNGETLVANSNGVRAYHEGRSASLSTILMGEKGSGYASQSAKGGKEILAGDIAKRAVRKATYGEILDVPPGEYEVILESPAVAELMDFFAWLGPNARVYHEDVSFYQGNLGKQVFDRSLTILDDPLEKAGYPMGFDFEGAPKKRLTLVEAGTLRCVVYDSYHAGKHGKENTGHALLAPNTWGPTPTHLVIKPGNLSLEQMIKKVKKGLLITRFWYTRVVQHKQLTLTGMTRDGTFYIENGNIVGRARNLRYTQSIVEAFKDVRGIGKELSLHGSEGSPSLVPHLYLGKFRFTGVTKHG